MTWLTYPHDHSKRGTRCTQIFLFKLTLIQKFLFHRTSPGKSSIYCLTYHLGWFPACIVTRPALWGGCFNTTGNTGVHMHTSAARIHFLRKQTSWKPTSSSQVLLTAISTTFKLAGKSSPPVQSPRLCLQPPNPKMRQQRNEKTGSSSDSTISCTDCCHNTSLHGCICSNNH